MLIMVLRKMIKNKWMVLCLLIGFVIAVAMVSSIPIYTDGVLQRMLTRDLENYQITTGSFPGRYHASSNIFSNFAQESRDKAFRVFDERITKNVTDDIGIPIITYTRNIAVEYLKATPEIQREEDPMNRTVSLETLHGLEDHIEIVNGRMYSSEKKDGIYEVIVNEETMRDLDLRLDEVYLIEDYVKRFDDSFKVKVVGIYTIKDSNDPYWFQALSVFNNCFMMDENLFVEEFLNKDLNIITKAQWYYAFDYHKIGLNDIPRIMEAYNKHNRWFSERRVELRMPAISVLEKYYDREQQLKTTLWVVQVPVLMMLGFYLFMVSRLIIEQEKNEIAVMKSRGASSLQVFFGYLIESLILGVMALLVGPPWDFSFATS